MAPLASPETTLIHIGELGSGTNSGAGRPVSCIRSFVDFGVMPDIVVLGASACWVHEDCYLDGFRWSSSKGTRLFLAS